MITWAIGTLLGLPLYLLFGYLLGKITVKEFQNDTPTEKLSWLGKIKRTLLFPIVYKRWSKRYNHTCGSEACSCSEIGGISGVEGMLRDTGNYHSNHKLELNVKNYLKVISLLWPFKIAPFVAGLIISVFLLLFNGMEYVWEKMEKVFSRTSYFGNSSDFHDKSILRLKDFRDKEISERMEKLEEAAKERKEQIQSLDALNNQWLDLIGRIGSESKQAERFEIMRAKLLENQESLKRELVQTEKAVKIILENGKELDILIEALELYSKSRDITVKENIPLVKEQIGEMLSSAEAAITGIREAYQIEMDLMAKLDAPVEDMARQFAEGKNKAKELSEDKQEAIEKFSGVLSSIRNRI